MERLKSKLPANVYDSLVKANIDSMDTIIKMNVTELQQLTSMSYSESIVVREEACSIVTNTKFTTVSELDEPQRLSTGCKNIDSLLRNGIPARRLTEIAGESGCGKTQFCLQLLLTVQRPEDRGGFDSGAVYICTEDSFPSKRLHQLCANVETPFGCAGDKILEDNVFVDHIADYEQFRRCLFIRLPNLLASKRIRLLVVDSIAGIWRHDNKNINYYERSLQILNIAKQLHELSCKYNLAVVCVNQVVDNIATGETDSCLGLSWSNLIHYRIHFTRFGQKIRKFEIKFAPDVPQGSCEFIITDSGILDFVL